MEIVNPELIQDIGSKISDFKILNEIGRGSYGIVYRVYSYVDGNVYVIKKMDFKYMKEKQQKEAWREAMILKKLSHPNIIK
jgi:NIMA (never in mitosis gene a)-related kinase